jgi:serine/threonine-protein kinase HipA
MNAADIRDTLYLWWLGRPDAPVLIGDLRFVRTLRSVSLRYDPRWLASGFPLSEDLPLIDHEFLPAEKDVAAGAVDDARPDRWGERVIRFLDRPSRTSLMEFLFLAGDDRFGALGVSLSRDEYVPRRLGALPQLADMAGIQSAVQAVIAGEPIPENLKCLIAPGVTMGGARPKALITLDGAPWVIKFAEPGDVVDTPLVEHATMTLASAAGIRTAPTQAMALAQGHAVAVKRFDREGDHRRHALSAHVALKAAGEVMGYPELSQLLRRRGPVRGGVSHAHMRELFRRMVFNILIDNTDDHEKNHALLMNDRGEYELSPAFDVLPTGQSLGYQQMRVGSDGATSTVSNALSEAAQFGLSTKDAHDEVRRVVSVVGQWRGHFDACGVCAADIESLAGQIDRPGLLGQRQAWAEVVP